MYWTVHLSGGPQRVNHAAVVIGDKIYSFGGYCSGENYAIETPIDVHILYTVNLKWKMYLVPKNSTQEAPFQRYGHTAVAHGTKVYIWGGCNDEYVCNQLFCFDTETFQWSCVQTQGNIPEPRNGHSACIITDSMYIFGGFDDDTHQFCNDVYRLNLNDFTWTYVVTQGEQPSFRDFHTASAIGDRMYVFGGRGEENTPDHSHQTERYCNNIFYLDVMERKWYMPPTTGDIPMGRRSHSAFIYKNQIYIFGGVNGLINTHFNDLHRFDPQTCIWQQVVPRGEPPCKRRRQSCVVSGDRMFLFGGTSPIPENELSAILYLLPVPNVVPDPSLTDHDDLHILDCEPSLATLCLLTVIKNKLDVSCLPEDLKWELKTMTTKNVIQRFSTAG